jgi:hypothetical protein
MGVVVVVLLTAGGALLLALGAADPPLAGPLAWEETELAWAGGPSLRLDAGASAWYTAPPSARLPVGAFTLDVRARLSPESDPGTAWGVWLERPDGARVIYALSGEQYTTTRVCPTAPPAALEDCPALRPEWRWMPYPLIHTPGTANRITLHREQPGAVRLRLNDERMGIAPVALSGRWGLWARGGRAGVTVIDWQWARLYAPDVGQ